MKKLIVLFLTFTLLCSMTACSPKSSDEKTVLFSAGGSASYTTDLSTIKNLVNESDLIIKAKVTKIDEAYYKEDAYWFYFPVTAKVEEVLYGTYEKNKIEFGYGFGNVSVTEYQKSIFADGSDSTWYDKLTEEEKANSVVAITRENVNLLEKGKEYVFCFVQEEDGSYYPHSGGRGVLEIDGEYLNQTTDGHEFLLANALEQIKTGIFAEEPIPYSTPAPILPTPRTFTEQYTDLKGMPSDYDEGMRFKEENMANGEAQLKTKLSDQRREQLMEIVEQNKEDLILYYQHICEMMTTAFDDVSKALETETTLTEEEKAEYREGLVQIEKDIQALIKKYEKYAQ